MKKNLPARRFSLASFRKDTRGANMVEYMVVVGAVALLAIGGFKAFGDKVVENVGKQTKTVGDINSSAGGAK